MKSENIFHVCFCTDKRLLQHIPVVLFSILRRNSDEQICIHIIHDIKEDYYFIPINDFIAKHDNLSLKRYHTEWKYEYSGLKHVTKATMLRLYIPLLIQVERVLYLDVDVIVNASFSKIFPLETGDTGICMKNSIDKNWKLLVNENQAGNCGVMLMDLSLLREVNFTKQCLTLNELYKEHDQFIINLYCKGNHSILPSHLNIFFGQDDHLFEQKILEEKEFIFHYVGKMKPYNSYCRRFHYLWEDCKSKKNINRVVLSWLEKWVRKSSSFILKL